MQSWNSRFRFRALAIGGVVGAALCAGPAFASTIHFSNASAHSHACQAGDFAHIYITITSVQAHQSGNGNAGWHTIAQPDKPVQMDLLDEGADESTEPASVDDCVLSSLGTDSGLPAGQYQQIRIIVDANGGQTAPDDNACSSLGNTVYNCVQLKDTTFHALDTPSAGNTGIKIPSTKIRQGGLRLSSGDGVDLDIDINACRSVVQQGAANHRHKKGGGGGGGNKSYSLKPVLQAGEVSLNPIIAGQVVEGSSNGGGVTGNNTGVPNAAVWLEDPSKANSVPEGTPSPNATNVSVNEVIAETTTDSHGNFVFCPAPQGNNLEVVANAATMPNGANPSDVTITTGINVTANGGPNDLVIPLVEPTAKPTAAAQFTTQSSIPPPQAETLDLGMCQSDGANQAPFDFANSGAVSPTTTAPGGIGCVCPVGIDCSCAILDVPADEPVIGAAGGSYNQSGGAGDYSVLAKTSASSGAGSCAPPELVTAPNSSASPLPTPTLSFKDCQ